MQSARSHPEFPLIAQASARTSVVPKAAMEEVKSLSTNGSSATNGAALDFDELTDLIKCVFADATIQSGHPASTVLGADAVPASPRGIAAS